MTFLPPRLAAFAAAALATLLATSSPAAASTAAPPATTTDPAAAAAGWLAQQFVDASNHPSPSGDHFTFPGSTFYYAGLTEDAVFGLAATKTGGDKIRAAVNYVAAHVADDAMLTDTSGKPGPFDGSVAKAALAAIVAGDDPTRFGGNNLLQALKDDECTAVSAPVDQNDFTTPTCPAVGAARNIFSSVSESLAILVQARGAAAFGARYKPSTDAVKYFLSLRCPDGGFTGATSAGSTCTSSVDETGYAAAALAALGDHPSELAAADAWLRSTRNPAGYWVAQGGPDVDSTGLAVAALEAAGDNVSASRAWLAAQQVTSGPSVGPGASRGALAFQGSFDASSSVKATADGLLGLARSGFLATLTAAGASAGTAVLAPSSTASAASVAQGGTQTVTAIGFAAGEQVSAVLHSTPVPLQPVTASAGGTVTLRFTVPSTLAPGTHEVVLTGVGSGLTSTVRFTVVGAAIAPTHRARSTPSATAAAVPASTSTSAEPPLAASGRDGRQTARQTLLGLGLVLGGAGALYAGRRRRA